jgi:putative tryptophan/tyrosine transport system substrate-binding protein
MRRREFLWLLGYGVAANWACSVRAQQPAKVYRIAIVSPATPVAEMNEAASTPYRAFLGELRLLGHVEGQNLVIERFSGGGRSEHYRELVGDVVRSSPDAILTTSSNLLLEFKAQTTTIPIVGVVPDPLALGIVPSLARPGGNITGASVDAGIEIWGKRLGLLKEALPKLSRIGFLVTPTSMGKRGWAMLKEVSEKEDVSLVGSPIDSPIDETAYRRAFAAIVQEAAEAVFVGDESENFSNRRLIVELGSVLN